MSSFPGEKVSESFASSEALKESNFLLFLLRLEISCRAPGTEGNNLEINALRLALESARTFERSHARTCARTHAHGKQQLCQLAEFTE